MIIFSLKILFSFDYQFGGTHNRDELALGFVFLLLFCRCRTMGITNTRGGTVSPPLLLSQDFKTDVPGHDASVLTTMKRPFVSPGCIVQR